jgi:septal ring factor EnvC (AmiA/AmiB activator)
MHPTRSSARLLLAWAVWSVLAVPPVDARKDNDVQARRGELDELKGRIDALRKEVAQAEESRADAADELEETERAISEANRRLRELAEQRGGTQGELAALESEARRIEVQVGAQQAQLSRLLRSRHMAGEGESLHHLLRGRDPNQLARDAHYLAKLSQAQASLIAGLRLSLERKRLVAQRVREKNEQLAGIEQEQRKEHAELLAQQNKRRSVLDSIAGQIKTRRREIENLKRDERRLARLIDGLSRIVRKPPKPARATAAVPTPTPSPAPAGGDSLPPPAVAPPRAEETAAPGGIAHNDRTPDGSLDGRSFSGLRGQLRLPVRGELINRFGAPRHDGGTSWKGVFLRAGQGAEVRAVASGQVVFADWLRGFGNLIILDHGDSYLSVYGSNESVFKAVGQTVRAGEVIAAVGNSGGNAETGLYFELRHQGQPLDPMKWVNLR